jgi:hypothetical protein
MSGGLWLVSRHCCALYGCGADQGTSPFFDRLVKLDVDKRGTTVWQEDGCSFTELARAQVPHAIPYGFHGQFSRRR